jgi:2-haloacid dehalogenase
MPAWPGAAQAISALRRRFLLAPLTILSLPMVVGSSRHSGIDWDCILSCDLLGVYKPDPRAYGRAIEVLGVEAPEVMMVASHPSDLRAARAAGWRTAYVRARLLDPGEDYEDRGFDREFDLVVENFDDLAERLLAT